MIAFAHLEQGYSTPFGSDSVGAPCAGSHAFLSEATCFIPASSISINPMIAFAHLEVKYAICCRRTCWRLANRYDRRMIGLQHGLLLMLARCHIQRHQYSVGDDAAPRLGKALDSVVAKVPREPSCSKARCPSNGFALDSECPRLLATLNNRSH